MRDTEHITSTSNEKDKTVTFSSCNRLLNLFMETVFLKTPQQLKIESHNTTALQKHQLLENIL